MWLNYHHLHYFWKVVQEGGVTKASQALHVSQSAVTIQLRLLSEQLKVELFRKSGRNLKLTEDGARIYEYAQRIFSLGDEMVTSLKKGIIPASKKVAIGASGGLSKNFQLKLLQPLIADPRIYLQVNVGDVSDLLQQLKDYKLDVVVTHFPAGAAAGPEFLTYEIGRSRFVIAAHRKWMAFKKKIHQLPQPFPMMLSMSGSGAHHRVSKRLPKNIFSQGIIEDVALIRTIALAGRCLVFAPKIAIEAELISGELIILKEFMDLFESFYLVERSGSVTNPLLDKAIGDLSKSRFGSKRSLQKASKPLK